MLSFKQFSERFTRQVQEGVPNPMMANNKELRYLDSLIQRGKARAGEYETKAKQILSNMYSEYMKQFQKIKKKLARIVAKETRKFKKVKILTDIKELEKIEDKAMDRGKAIIEMNDIVRGAVLFDTKADADKFVSKFMRRNSSMVAAYEEKKRGEDTEYGYYGSHHLDLNIDGMVVELQVMTRKMWSYKEAAHDIYNKYRSKDYGPDRFDQHMSKRLFSMANESVGIAPEFTLEEIEEMDGNWEEVDPEAVLIESVESDIFPKEVVKVMQAWAAMGGEDAPRKLSSTRKIRNTNVSSDAYGIGKYVVAYEVDDGGFRYVVTDGKKVQKSNAIDIDDMGQAKANALGKVLQRI